MYSSARFSCHPPQHDQQNATTPTCHSTCQALVHTRHHPPHTSRVSLAYITSTMLVLSVPVDVPSTPPARGVTTTVSHEHPLHGPRRMDRTLHKESNPRMSEHHTHVLPFLTGNRYYIRGPHPSLSLFSHRLVRWKPRHNSQVRRLSLRGHM